MTLLTGAVEEEPEQQEEEEWAPNPEESDGMGCPKGARTNFAGGHTCGDQWV